MVFRRSDVGLLTLDFRLGIPVAESTVHGVSCYCKAMRQIEPPDTHYFSAAIGWLELGVPAEAESELSRIRPALQSHPDILEVRWIILAQTSRWTPPWKWPGCW